tara:strand:- start:1136 stop:1510 length:375 start_codon:yes stop_codon:yes gene_type:complete
MTEEVLQAAILKLKSRALERFAIIKDLYHRPADLETTELIVKHVIAMAQLEGGMVTLQQYAEALRVQTDAEAESNKPEVTEVEVEEEPEEPEEPKGETRLNHDELMKRSSSYRKSQNAKGGEST